MKPNPKFRNGLFYGFESSPEILQAIEDVAGNDFDLDNLEECPAYRIWQEPTAYEIAEVERLAWGYAATGVDELHWGCETIIRPTPHPDPGAVCSLRGNFVVPREA